MNTLFECKYSTQLDAFKDLKQLISLLGFNRKPTPNPNTPGATPGQEAPTPAPAQNPANPTTPVPVPAPSTPTESPSVIPVPNFRPPIPHGQSSQDSGSSSSTTPTLIPRQPWKPSVPGHGVFSSSTATAAGKPLVNPFGARTDNKKDQFAIEGSLQAALLKLADEKIRSQIIEGFFGVTPKNQLSAKCREAIEEVKSLLPLLPQYLAVRQAASDSGRTTDATDLINSLSIFIKADAIVTKISKDHEYTECLGGSLKPFKVVLAKLLLANEEFIEKAKENTQVWISFATVALSFQMEMYNAAGQGLGDAVKQIAKTQVPSLPDSKAEKIDLWRCFTAMLKAKSQQKLTADDPEAEVNSWVGAAVDAKASCLATADLY